MKMGMKIEENKITVVLDEETCSLFDKNLDFMQDVAYTALSMSRIKLDNKGYVFIYDILDNMGINAYGLSCNIGYCDHIGARVYNYINAETRRVYVAVTFCDFTEIKVIPKVIKDKNKNDDMSFKTKMIAIVDDDVYDELTSYPEDRVEILLAIDAEKENEK